MKHLGAVELGGTKIRVARGTPDGAILDSDTVPTTGPDESIAKVAAFFAAGPPISALGIGSFGPIELNRKSPDFGRFLTTPKPGWQGFDLIGGLAPLNVPIRLETDVAAAGMGEHRRGALRGLDHGLYLTVGTGIGGALLIEGRVLNGAAHAEMGHLALIRAPDDRAASTCPYHSDCAEGLASGPAILRRFGHSLSAAEATDEQRALIADYLGQLMAGLVLAFAPERIVVGGGVAKATGLLSLAQERLFQRLNGYMTYPALQQPGFVTAPELGDDAGLTGALQLAAEAATDAGQW